MDKCGIVRLSDIQDPRRTAAFVEMEQFSDRLLGTRDRWWPDVPWPPDALHQWSRQYEYPWIYHHLSALLRNRGPVLDAGSGITFFPFFLKRLGFDVVCVDGDGRLGAAFDALNGSLSVDLRVPFELADLRTLPFRPDSFSSVICISVLEHMPPEVVDEVLAEFHRVVVRDGLCLITVDVTLESRGGESFLSPRDLDEFSETLRRSGFAPLFRSEPATSPTDLLSTDAFKNEPAYLPWSHSTSRTMAGALRHWAKRSILRRQTFHSVGLAVFACRRTALPDF